MQPATILTMDIVAVAGLKTPSYKQRKHL